jgi:predicted MFS family arabinose efflux permease
VKKSTFIILCLEGAVLSFNVAACAALIPSIAADFALSQLFVGRITWVYMLPYGLAALFYGPLVRLIDAKKVELLCLSLFSLANLLAAFSKSISALFFARFMMGLFGASVIPLGIILIARHVEEQKRGKSIGIFFGATFAASLLGLFLSGIIHWRLIFLIPGLFGFFLCAVIYLYLPSFKRDTGVFKLNYLPALGNKSFLAIFIYIFFISLIYHGVQQWLAVYFSTSFGFTQLLISGLITLTSLSGIFGEFFGGALADSLGRVKTINLGILLMILSILSLGFKSPLFVLIPIMIAWGLGWTFNHAGLSTMLTDLPQGFLNEAASLNSGVRFISGGLGVAIGGIFIQKSFVFSFIIFALGLSALFLLERKLLIAKS